MPPCRIQGLAAPGWASRTTSNWGGVDFGPALGMDHYRCHGTDEYVTVEELKRITELTTAALWKLAR